MRPFSRKAPAPLSVDISAQAGGRILLGTLLWLFLWFAPWQAWVDTNLWLKTGVALAMFITPGAGLYLLVNRGAVVPSRVVTSGFVISHLLVALLGLAARAFQFPFLYVKNIFLALGLALMVAHLLANRHTKEPVTGPGRLIERWIARLLPYWPLGALAGLAMLMTVQRVISGDDLAYLAHVTNWQGMPALHFSDLYFGADQIESARFWLVSAPFSQAFLAEVAHIPGLLLLGGYYEPLLAFISVLCFYDLARTLGLSRASAMASTGVQVAFLALLSQGLHPGAPFFHQLSTDKATAAFILSPVFIANAVQLLAESKKSTLVNFLLSGTSLGFMHPILAAFSVFIVGTVALLGIRKDNLKKHGIVILLAAVTLLPQVCVRLVDHEAQPRIPTTIEGIEQARGMGEYITRVDNTPFYGFNPRILEMRLPYQARLPFPAPFLGWIWIIVPVLSAFAALKGIRSSTLQQTILAATLLVALAGVPYTGWLLGAFVSAWMLERTTWLYPFGISAVFLLLAFRDHTRFGKSLNAWKLGTPGRLQLDFASLGRASIWAVSVVCMVAVMREQGLPDFSRLENATFRYRILASIGQYIDDHAPGPVNVVGSDDLNDFIPALSWKAKVISYRPEDAAYPYFFSEEEKLRRWSDRRAILSREHPPDERMQIIRKYAIRYLLIEANGLGRLQEVISVYPAYFKVLPFGKYYLIEIIDTPVVE